MNWFFADALKYFETIYHLYDNLSIFVGVFFKIKFLKILCAIKKLAVGFDHLPAFYLFSKSLSKTIFAL